MAIFYKRVDQTTKKNAEDVSKFITDVLVSAADGPICIKHAGVIKMTALKHLEDCGIVERDRRTGMTRLIDKKWWRFPCLI